MISWVKMMEMEKYTPHSCKFFDAAGARGEGPETPRIMAQTFHPYPNETLMKKYLFWASRDETESTQESELLILRNFGSPPLPVFGIHPSLHSKASHLGMETTPPPPPLYFLHFPSWSLHFKYKVKSSPRLSTQESEVRILHYFGSPPLPVFWTLPSLHSKVCIFGLETCATISFLHFCSWILHFKSKDCDPISYTSNVVKRYFGQCQSNYCWGLEEHLPFLWTPPPHISWISPANWLLWKKCAQNYLRYLVGTISPPPNVALLSTQTSTIFKRWFGHC